MNRALELHDSNVAQVRGEGDRLSVQFSEGYVHASDGTPGVSAGDGYLQPATLVFAGASWSNDSPALNGKLSDGTIEIDGRTVPLIPIPFDASGKVTAELVFVSGERLRISAQSVSCSAHGEPRWVEAYAG